MKTIRLITISLLVVVGVTFFGYQDGGLFGALLWGSLAVGIVSCSVSGWLLFSEVKAHGLPKGLAILLYLGICVLNVLLPIFVTGLPEFLGFGRPHSGESGLVVLGFCYIMLLAAVVAIIVFITCVLVAKKA
jgi:hypothetical protein